MGEKPQRFNWNLRRYRELTTERPLKTDSSSLSWDINSVLQHKPVGRVDSLWPLWRQCHLLWGESSTLTGDDQSVQLSTARRVRTVNGCAIKLQTVYQSLKGTFLFPAVEEINSLRITVNTPDTSWILTTSPRSPVMWKLIRRRKPAGLRTGNNLAVFSFTVPEAVQVESGGQQAPAEQCEGCRLRRGSHESFWAPHISKQNLSLYITCNSPPLSLLQHTPRPAPLHPNASPHPMGSSVAFFLRSLLCLDRTTGQIKGQLVRLLEVSVRGFLIPVPTSCLLFYAFEIWAWIRNRHWKLSSCHCDEGAGEVGLVPVKSSSVTSCGRGSGHRLPGRCNDDV